MALDNKQYLSAGGDGFSCPRGVGISLRERYSPVRHDQADPLELYQECLLYGMIFYYGLSADGDVNGPCKDGAGSAV